MNRLKKILIGLFAFFSVGLALIEFLTIYNLGKNHLALLFLSFLCLVNIFFRRGLIRLPLYIASLLLIVYQYFPYGERFSITWFSRLWTIIRFSFHEMINRQIDYIPEVIALLIIMTGVIFLTDLLISYEFFFIGYLIIIGYLLTIVLFNDISLSMQIMAVLSCGLLSMALKRTTLTSFRQIGHFFFLSLMLSICFVAAFFLPKTPLRNQLVAETNNVRAYFNQTGLYSYIQNYGGSGISRTGFGENDQQLGGPLLDDNTVLFESFQKTRHYWRVESKDAYSGKGWHNSFEENQSTVDPTSLEVQDTHYHQYYPQTENIQIFFYEHGDYLPLPYGKKEITLEHGAEALQLIELNQRVNLLNPIEQTKVSIAWSQPDYTAEVLENIPHRLPAESLNYLQLPTDLPTRVKDLATDIIENETRLYHQVTAIERYLKNPINYRYSKTDAVVPSEEEDYVDQFLFESKVGYCDNFSSSMVVLLRSLGIPARWAKGFSPGDSTALEDEFSRYTIRNRNAHSWPEVYFEGYGWVPFEPTPSFHNPQRPAFAAEEPEADAPEASENNQTAISSTKSSDTAETTETTSDSANAFNLADNQYEPVIRRIIVVFLLLALIGIFYFIRKYLFRIRIWFICRFARQPLLAAYPILLKQLQKVLYRADSEPLLVYAQRLEKMYPSFEWAFIQLTEAYEALLYSESVIPDQRKQLQHTAQLVSRLKKKARIV